MDYNLQDKAMLVSLNISQWSGRKYDPKATQAAWEAFGATDSGRFNKALLAKDALKAITRAANDARTFHYQHTLPWTDKGDRVLPAAMFDKYASEMRQLKAAFENAVNDFVANYDGLMAEARVRLNGMFSYSDYPRYVADRFSFGFHISAIPMASDFRIELQSYETERIKADIEDRVRRAAQAGHKDLYRRLYEEIAHMIERLSDNDKTFRDSTVGNLIKLCELIPALNIAGDPVLEKLRKDVESKLTSIDPQTLRDNADIRQQVAADAQTILKSKAMPGDLEGEYQARIRKADKLSEADQDKLQAMGSIFGGA